MRGPRLPRGLGVEGISGLADDLRHRAPAGLQQAEQLPETIFTPSTKAESGHDMNIPWDECRRDSSATKWPSRCGR